MRRIAIAGTAGVNEGRGVNALAAIAAQARCRAIVGQGADRGGNRAAARRVASRQCAGHRHLVKAAGLYLRCAAENIIAGELAGFARHVIAQIDRGGQGWLRRKQAKHRIRPKEKA